MDQSKIEALAQLLDYDEPENYLKTLNEWFLSYVANELSGFDQETHERHVIHFVQLKRLFTDI